jgi:hypothetical protein
MKNIEMVVRIMVRVRVVRVQLLPQLKVTSLFQVMMKLRLE